jgi:hypothetical protein
VSAASARRTSAPSTPPTLREFLERRGVVAHAAEARMQDHDDGRSVSTSNTTYVDTRKASVEQAEGRLCEALLREYESDEAALKTIASAMVGAGQTVARSAAVNLWHGWHSVHGTRPKATP